MTRLASALRLEVTLAVRQRFLHAAVFSGLIWLAVLLPMPQRLRPVAEPYILVGDLAIIGFFFVGGTVFFEKQERTLGAVISTPLRFWEYLAAKLTVLLLITLFVSAIVVTAAHGFAYHLVPLLAGVVLGTLLMLLVGFITSLPFASVSDWFLAATIPLAVMLALPVLHYSGVWPNPMLYLIPTQGPLLLLGAAFDQVTLAPWQIVVCVGVSGRVPGGVVLAGQRDVRPLRDRAVGGAVMAMSAVAGRRALAAFGRNDIRGTYRDPLLVMIVVAPIIWTLGVVILAPLFTEMLAERYEFDLVPYYPLVLTAFLLLTSIVIAGGLGAFLVLDEVDAGTLTALRVTPVPLSTFFAYRAGTVMVVTTVYVVATMSLSGILAPALIPALIPIGLLAGLSGGCHAAADRRGGEQQDPGHRDGPRAGHADRRAAVPAVVHRLAPGTSPSACCRRIGRPRRSGWPATTAPGGPTLLSASSTTSPSPGRCSAASSPKTPDPSPPVHDPWAQHRLPLSGRIAAGTTRGGRRPGGR